MQSNFNGRTQPALSRLAIKPCVNCRQRKVKCDRGQPCTECVRFSKNCVYEDSHIPARTTTPHDQTALKDRLDRLERLLAQNPEKQAAFDNEVRSLRSGIQASNEAPKEPHFSSQAPGTEGDGHGSLVYDRGMSQYIMNEHWTRMFQEDDELNLLLGSNELSPELAEQSLLLAPTSHTETQPSFTAPSLAQGTVLCNIFFQRVEPFIRVLHESSFKRERQQYLLGKSSSQSEFEALLYSVYALSVLSCPSELVNQVLGEDRSAALARYQAVTEAALRRIQFLRNRSLTSLQALLYYVTLLLENGSFEVAISMVGVAEQVARRMGLHKVAFNSKVMPFVADMRRRAMHHLTFLRYRSFEIEGQELEIRSEDDDCLLPKSVNEADWEKWLHTRLSPPPQNREGNSDITFIKLRSYLTRQLYNILSKCGEMSIDQTEQKMQDIQFEFQTKYLQNADYSQPMPRFLQLYGQIFVDKIALAVDITHTKYGRSTTNEFKNNIFFRSVDILSRVTAAETEFANYGWSWIFRGSPEWYPIAALLCHLVHRTDQFTPEAVAQVWQQAEAFFARHDNADFSIRDCSPWRLVQRWRQQALDMQLLNSMSNAAAAGGGAGRMEQEDFDWSAAVNLDLMESEGFFEPSSFVA
ncbi:MAG: hypothetical protein Q9227_004353 [Pyrenula ochraceoflavens]